MICTTWRCGKDKKSDHLVPSFIITGNQCIIDILHKNFQEDHINSRRFPGVVDTLCHERQSARMSKITNDDLSWSGTRCFIAVSLWQQSASS